MGLAVSQIRLLALTSRKADIELQMQINSKRKQMLTRQSTELSNQYYQRLQNSTIQYATSSGYEDVDYNYLMGYSVGGHITDEFFNQIMTGSDQNIAVKPENRMILTNQFGEVIVDNDIAKYVASAEQQQEGGSILEKTSRAIYNMIEAKSIGTQQQLSALYNELSSVGSIDDALGCIQLMIRNGGYMSGGTLYEADGTPGVYYKSYVAAQDAKANKPVSDSEIVRPIAGYCYDIKDQTGKSLKVSRFYDGVKFLDSMTQQYCKYLGNLVSYFAPIMSAALLNGMSAAVETSAGGGRGEVGLDHKALINGDQVEISLDNNPGLQFAAGTNYNGVVYSGKYKDAEGTEQNTTNTKFETAESVLDNDECLRTAIKYFSTNGSASFVKVAYQESGATLYKYYSRGSDEQDSADPNNPKNYMSVKSISQAEFNDCVSVTINSNKGYTVAQDKEKFQAGFKSGIYQLAMVGDTVRGTLKKNTLLNYFTSMHYVVDRTDNSKREEITAWFNAEQAIISEKETYWDTEIQNLSTELNSVNTEIESVKKLKSDAIKSVFDWGGN